MAKKYLPKYPLVWQKDDFFIKIYCSIPNIATGIVLTTDKSAFLVDPGDGILRDLNKEFDKKEILTISDIFISHGHHDHIGGLWTLLTYFSVMNRKAPLNIYYPKGSIEIISIHKAFSEVYSEELTYMVKLIPINGSKTFTRKTVKVKPFEVNHREPLNDGTGNSVPIPSFGYKFTYKGMSICYGGDTAYSTNLVKNAKNSDLAIIEAGAENEEDSDLHMTYDQAVEIGMSAKEFFLVHVPEKMES